MQYAVIKTGGKQYQVTLGQVLEVEQLGSEGPITFDEVLLYVDGEDVRVGMPTVAGLKVSGTILGVKKAKKLEIFRYKSKSRYRKHTGHRQAYSQVRIETIGKLKSPAKPKTVKKVATKKPSVKKLVK